jgi:hypothetical protein
LLEIFAGKLLAAGTAANTFIGRAFAGAFVAAVQFVVFFDCLALFYFTSARTACTRYFCHVRSPPFIFNIINILNCFNGKYFIFKICIAAIKYCQEKIIYFNKMVDMIFLIYISRL